MKAAYQSIRGFIIVVHFVPRSPQPHSFPIFRLPIIPQQPSLLYINTVKDVIKMPDKEKQDDKILND